MYSVQLEGNLSPSRGRIKKLNSETFGFMTHANATSGGFLECWARKEFFSIVRYNSYIIKFTLLKCAVEWL